MNQHLVETLQQAGKPSHVYRAPDGSQLLVLPHGGRILGLFAFDHDENFYWTHSSLDSPETAEEFYAGEQWHNSGGDRTWLAPEVDFFFPHFPALDVYFQPRQLDPGNWQLERQHDSVRLVNRLTCRLSRSQSEVETEITKSLLPAADPLRYEGCQNLASEVQYAGYTLRTTLQISGDDAQRQGPVGLWNLIQMPHGGEMLIPTCCRSKPRVLFGEISTDDLVSSERVIRYAMHSPGEQKIAVRALPSTGRIGYRYPTAHGSWALVVRNIFINPSGQYVDVPWDDVDDMGYAIQACHVHSGLGSFSELEYHVPAVGAGTGRTCCEDVSQTWAYRGSREAIDQIVERLLIS